MGVSVLSVSSRALIDACARLGLDTDRILAAAGLLEAPLRPSVITAPYAEYTLAAHGQRSGVVLHPRHAREDAARSTPEPIGHRQASARS